MYWTCGISADTELREAIVMIPQIRNALATKDKAPMRVNER